MTICFFSWIFWNLWKVLVETSSSCSLFSSYYEFCLTDDFILPHCHIGCWSKQYCSSDNISDFACCFAASRVSSSPKPQKGVQIPPEKRFEMVWVWASKLPQKIFLEGVGNWSLEEKAKQINPHSIDTYTHGPWTCDMDLCFWTS